MQKPPRKRAIAVPMPAIFAETRSLGMRALVVLLGSLFIAASAQISIPIYPVPVTMQTFAVLTVGALCGWRLGGLTVLAYLAEGAAGLPVFANGMGGPAPLMGPTAGYLLAFPVGAALAGFATERGWMKNIVTGFGVMLVAHAVIIAVGTGWLATQIGWTKAIALGVTPFIVGTLLKSALGVATVRAADLVLKRR